MRDRWIRVHARLVERPLVARMAEDLKVPCMLVVGHLATFWGAAAEHADNGTIADVPDALLERWAQWGGKRGAWANAVRRHHMDEGGRIKEWDEYQGPLEERRARDRERLKQWRERQRNAPETTNPPVRNADETNVKRVTKRGRNRVTERNGTERNKDQVLTALPDADAQAPRTTWLTPFLGLWQKHAGAPAVGQMAKYLAPVVKLYGADDALAGLGAFLEEPRPPDKPVKISYFAESAKRWIDESREPMIRDGIITPRGQRMMGRPA